MTTKTRIIISVVVGATLFAFGRYTAPVKTVVEKQIVEVEKKTENSEVNKHKETTVTEIEKPDGTKEKTTKIVEDTEKNKNKITDSVSAEYEKKEVIKSSSRLSISVLAGAKLDNPTIIYGAHVKRDLLGPISVGVWGLTDKTIGASVGLEF